MFALLNICLLIALVLLTVLSILHCSDRYPLHFGQPPCLSLCLRQILLRSSDHFFKSCIAFTEAWFLFFLPATLLLYSLIFHCPSLMSLLISWVARSTSRSSIIPFLIQSSASMNRLSLRRCLSSPHIIKGLHHDGHWHVSGKRTGCRRCFVHAADYRRYGKWSSRICSGCVPPLSGYFARAKKPAGERGSLKTFLWHAIFLQRNLRTLTISVSGCPAISSPCREHR